MYRQHEERKKWMAAVLIAVLAVMSAGCAKQEAAEEASADSQTYTGIISAMGNEVELLLAEAEIDHVDTVGGIDFNVGTLREKPVVIAKAGIGKVLSASGAAIALVSIQFDTPFVVIRAMSDKADGKAHESIENMRDIAADNSSRIVMKMLESM